MTQTTDIIIAGGGLSGLALACILANSGMHVTCIDGQDLKDSVKTDFDGRTTAISAGSRDILKKAGIWNEIEKDGCPIEDIHITDNGSPVLLQFLVKDVDEDAFGWIFENRILRAALYNRAKTFKNLSLVSPDKITDISYTDEDRICVRTASNQNITAQLLIGADGRGSFVREWAGIKSRKWSYHQNAIICVVNHSQPHNNVAIEDFRNEGPFAVLPLHDDEAGQHRSAIVWNHHSQREDENPFHWKEDIFEVALNERFPDFYGEIKIASKRGCYPLSLNHAHHYIAKRIALVADAAHGMHPIAGQGLNLGYRDVDEISNILIDAYDAKKDLGTEDLLNTYQSKRRLDVSVMMGTTDILNRLFSNRFKTIGLMRKIGLKGVEKFAPAKKFFMTQAMGKTGRS